MRSTTLERIPGSGATPRGIAPRTPGAGLKSECGFLGSGERANNGYVLPNLKIRTKQLVHDDRKLQSPWVVHRTVCSGATASGGDCVLRSATRIPSLHRFGLERQGRSRDSRRYQSPITARHLSLPAITALSAFLPNPPIPQLLVHSALSCFIHTNQLRPPSMVTFARELAGGVESHMGSDVR